MPHCELALVRYVYCCNSVVSIIVRLSIVIEDVVLHACMLL